jgi:hypothetical protein
MPGTAGGQSVRPPFCVPRITTGHHHRLIFPTNTREKKLVHLVVLAHGFAHRVGA